MRRREFVAAAGTATWTATWALRAVAQHTKMPVVGVLIAGTREPTLTLLREGLRAVGYRENNIHIEGRWADGNAALLPELAAELVRLNVDTIVATPTPAVEAARQATRAIPIVMAPAGDPIGTGFIASFAHPGGNITGLSAATAEIVGKSIELLKEIKPALAQATVLANATDPFTRPFLDQIRTAAKLTSVVVEEVAIGKAEELDLAFLRIVQSGGWAVIVQPSLSRGIAAELGLKHRLPVVCPNPGFAALGGLLAYAWDSAEIYRNAAVYVDKILKGSPPAELPVELPTKFRLEINLKTANAIGVEIPATLLARADEVVE